MSDHDQTPTSRRNPKRRGFPRRAASTEKPLSAREQRFVDEYLVDLKGEAAAIRAGYSPKTAKVQASQTLTRLNVQAAVEAGYKARQKRTQITGDATVRELNRLAHADIRQFYDEHGQLKPIHELPDDLAACISSIEVVKKNLTAGDGTLEYIYRIKLWNKPQALELLGRHQGIFREDQPSDAPDVPAFTLPPDTPGVRVH